MKKERMEVKGTLVENRRSTGMGKRGKEGDRYGHIIVYIHEAITNPFCRANSF